jgi:DNA replication protein DnaC
MRKQIEKIEVWKKGMYKTLLFQFPKRTQSVLKAPNHKELDAVNSSRYVYGKARTGKSVAVAQMALEWSITRFIHSLQYEYIYVTVPEMLLELRMCYNNPDMSELAVMEKYKSAKLLVLDDIGAMKTTEWAYQMLYMILAYRYDEMKTTYYTSNYSLEELGERLNDDRITSRIAHECKGNIIHFENEPFL